MVSIAIFAILVAAVYSTWMVILKSSQVGQEAAAQVQRQRIAVRVDRRFADVHPVVSILDAILRFYRHQWRLAGVEFRGAAAGHFSAQRPVCDSNLRRLTFTVEPPPAGLGYDTSEKDLVLRQNRSSWTWIPTNRHDPLVLARKVKSFVVECWDTNAMDWAQEWDNTNSIPPMVRVTLTLENDAMPNSTCTITREIASAVHHAADHRATAAQSEDRPMSKFSSTAKKIPRRRGAHHGDDRDRRCFP